jgi:hypothetical protein
MKSRYSRVNRAGALPRILERARRRRAMAHGADSQPAFSFAALAGGPGKQ